MRSLAERSIFRSTRLAALTLALVAGGVVGGCSQAPKIGKEPEPTQSSDSKSAGPEANAPAPTASAPEPSAPAPSASTPEAPQEAQRPDAGDKSATNAPDSKPRSYHYSRRDKDEPAEDDKAAPEQSPDTQQGAGGGAAPDSAPTTEEPSGGAAPPTGQAEAPPPAPPPPPPPSLGQGAPPPAAEQPPPPAAEMAPTSPAPAPEAGAPTEAQPPPAPPPPRLGQGAPPPTAEPPPPPAAEIAPAPPPAPEAAAPSESQPAPPPSADMAPSPPIEAPGAGAPSGGLTNLPSPKPELPAPVTSPAPPAAPADAARAAADADPSKTYDVVPVFYGTDRAAEINPNRLSFGSERGHKLQLGRALITVPLAHKVPHIERPWLIEIPYFKVKVYEEKEDPAKHFTVQEISALSEDQMLALVKQRLAQSATFKDHAFVFVHGFNTSFDNALYRTAQIAYDLKFDGAPFVYSWPSGGAVASYTYDHGSVEQSEPTLAEFLKLVVQKSGAKSISLIAHSMGNELLLRVLQTLRPQVPDGVVISQVILAAPDVDRDKFNIIAREITNFARGVTLYAASNDRALGYSAKFWGGVPRAGDVPKKGGPLIIPGVDTIDVTAVSTDALGLNHSGYAENPALLDDVKALVEFGLRPPDKRIKGVLTVQADDGIFWRFPPQK